MTQIVEPFPIFLDADGTPLENGMIYVGEANEDPRANPVQVYTDEALTVTIAQPIRTLGGRPAVQGSPVNIYAAEPLCSVLVQDRDGVLVTTSPEVGLSAQDIYFIQSGTGAVERTVQAKLRDTVSVKDFGATGDGVTDDTARIQAAIDAAGAAGGGVVFFPAGTYRTTATINVNQNLVTLKGAGIDATNIAPATAGQVGVLFQNAGGGPIEYCGIEGMDIFPTASIADCIRVIDHFWFTAKSLRMPSGYTTGINLYKGSTAYLAFLEDIFTNGGTVGVRVGESGTGDIQNVFLYNCHLNSATQSGLRIKNVGGLQWIGGEALGCDRGVIAEASGTDRIKALFFSSIYFDNADNETVRLVVTDATARLSWVTFTSCSLNFSQTGNGVLAAGVSGDPGQLERLCFSGCDFLLNETNGAYLTACRDIEFTSCHAHGNSDGTTNTNSGILIDSNVEGVRIIGGSIGSEDEYAPSQRHGVTLASGVSEILISGVDLTGNVTGAIDDQGATSLIVRDCNGYRTNNRGLATVASGNSSVAVAHGLAATPAQQNIQISPASDVAERWWVSAADATNFTISLSGAAGADRFFGWSAGVKGA